MAAWFLSHSFYIIELVVVGLGKSHLEIHTNLRRSSLVFFLVCCQALFMDSWKWNDFVQQQICLAENSEGCTWSRLLLRSQRRQGSVKCSSQGHHWAWWCREFSENGLAAYKQAEASVSGNAENPSWDHCPTGKTKLACRTKGFKFIDKYSCHCQQVMYFSFLFYMQKSGPKYLSWEVWSSQVEVASRWSLLGVWEPNLQYDVGGVVRCLTFCWTSSWCTLIAETEGVLSNLGLLTF